MKKKQEAFSQSVKTAYDQRSATALAAVTTPDILVRVQLDPLAIKLDMNRTAGELATLDDSTIDNEEDAIEANEYLKARLRERDALEALRKAAVAPLNEEHDRIQGMFKPALALYDAIKTKVKASLGAYALAQQAEQRRLLAEVAAVAQEPTPDALTEALACVDDAEPTKLEGTSVRGVWKVKRIVEGLLPREYMMPDIAKIEAFAKTHKPETHTAPILPGVIFELEAAVTVRR